MPIPYQNLGRDEERFAWTMKSGGEVFHIATGRLARYLTAVRFPVTDVAITQHLVDSVLRSNGVELEHLDRIPEGRLEEPGLFCACDDGTHMLADGSHRFLRRVLRRDLYFPACLVPDRIWRRFTISRTPIDTEIWRMALKRSQTAEGILLG